MFNVAFQRSYKQGDGWKNSTSFGRNSLLLPASRETPSMRAHQSQLARRLAGAPSYLSWQHYDEPQNV